MRITYPLLSLTMVISACSAFYPPVNRGALEDGKSHWFVYDSNYRGAIVISGGGRKFCAEPSPDTAVTGNIDVKIDVDKASVVDASVGLSAASALTRLSERSQAILVLRESMYRLCEQSINGNMSDNDYLDAFKETLNAVKLIFKTELKIAEGEENRSKAELAEAMKNLNPTELQFLFNQR